MHDLADRLFKFAVDVLNYLRTVENSEETKIIKIQLTKSATSSGANYEESQSSSSKLDFRNKVFISLKEMRESNYWLRICDTMEYGNVDSRKNLVNESTELKKILGSILSNLNKSMESKR